MYSNISKIRFALGISKKKNEKHINKHTLAYYKHDKWITGDTDINKTAIDHIIRTTT